ncbi:MAG: hypothetical protein ACXWQE_07650 [Bdellovibrionales bacterium]
MSFKEKFLSVTHWAYLFVLALGTLVILLRRLAWEQVPTQVSPFVVYLTLLLNCCWIALLIHRWARSSQKG